MSIFDGWFVYRFGTVTPITAATLDAAEVTAGQSNRTITNVDNSFVNGDTFTANIGTGGAAINLTFYGSNAGNATFPEDSIFVAFTTSTANDHIYLFSRVALSASSTLVVNRFGGINTSNGITTLLCFLSGTRLAAELGDVFVEDIRIGHRLRTAHGGPTEVRWLGKRTVNPLFTPAERGNPICIAAGALGENAPARDLYVSPDHAMFVDGLLVDAKALVNGTSITQVPRMTDTFTYWHVEVEGHHLLLAEGAPAESFVDTVGRNRFDNAAEYDALYPDAEPIIAMDLPRVSSARTLPAAIRNRLAARARSLGLAVAQAA